VSRLRLLSKQITHKQIILFTFDKIRFMGHLILGSLVQLRPITTKHAMKNLQRYNKKYSHVTLAPRVTRATLAGQAPHTID
jgi:hypothetical protein